MPPDDELDDDGRPHMSYGRKEWQRKLRVRFIAVLIGSIIIVLVLFFSPILDRKDMIDLEEKYVRMSETEVTRIFPNEVRGQMKGFYMERRFRSNQLILTFQAW